MRSTDVAYPAVHLLTQKCIVSAYHQFYLLKKHFFFSGMSCRLLRDPSGFPSKGNNIGSVHCLTVLSPDELKGYYALSFMFWSYFSVDNFFFFILMENT